MAQLERAKESNKAQLEKVLYTAKTHTAGGRSGAVYRYDGYFLQASFSVSLPGVEREVAQALLEAADQSCPYAHFWKRVTTWLGIPAPFARQKT